MRLDTFISTHGWSLKRLAEGIGVTHEAARKYVRGERIPRADIMQRIVDVTEGAVQPNDFFQTAKPEATPKASTPDTYSANVNAGRDWGVPAGKKIAAGGGD